MDDHLTTLAVAAFVSAAAAFIAKRLHFFTWPPSIPHPEIPQVKLRDVLEMFAVFLGIEFLLVPVLALLLFFPHLPKGNEPVFQDPIFKGWLNAGALVLVTGGVLAYFFLRKRNLSRSVFGPLSFKGVKRDLRHFFLGAASWLISYPFVLLISQGIGWLVSILFKPSPLEQVAVKQLKTTFTSTPLFFVTFILIVFIVPIVEELLFRGFLQTWLKGFLGRKKAILIASAIFASFHFASSQGLANIELLGSLFVLSCFLGFLYEKERSLLAPIGLHSVFNAISIAMIMSAS